MKNYFYILFLLISGFAYSQTTVTATPGGYTNVGGDDSFGVGNLGASDDSYECIDLDKNDGAQGRFNTFGFNIPSNATITSITVTFEGVWDDPDAPKNHKVSLWNSAQKSDKFINAQAALDDTEASLVNTDAGASIWGLAVATELTPALVNDGDFGLNIEDIGSSENGAEFCLDFAEISITYTTPLPVELVDFNVSLGNNEVKLEWSTASETNNDRFEVQRSPDGINWELLTTVVGAGNSNNILRYSIYDMNPLLGISYYRLKQIDFDGTFDYSKTEVIDNIKSLPVTIYPNPNKGIFNIKIDDSLTDDILVILRNAIGQEVYSKVIIKEYSNSIIVFDTLNKLSSGIYYVTGLNKQELFNKIIYIQ